MRFLKILTVGFLAMHLWLMPQMSCAEDISFEAFVNTNKVALGETLQLTLSFEGGQTDSPPEIPHIDGMEARYLGPSTSISIINGQYSSHVSFLYTLFPQKTGKFKIPSITVNVGGKILTSQPIDIEVVDAQTTSQSGGNDNASGEAAATTTIKDRIFVILETSQKELYLNQKIPLTIKLYINRLAVRDVQYPQFQHEGFTVGEFLKPKQYEQVLGGVRYVVLEFNTAVYPSRTGDLKLGPAALTCNLLLRNSNRQISSSSGFDNFFHDDFFEGFLNDYQKRAISISSVELPIHVLTLPEEGKPQNFSGAVGTFLFEAKASPQEVGVGDPITLRMTVSGVGNVQSVTMPGLKKDDQFKFYDPQIKEENGNKVLEQVVIPKSETITEIPAIRFSYFDPQKKTYQTITQGPFPITVKKSENKDDFKVIGFDRNKSSGNVQPPEELGQDIVFIKDSPGQFQRAQDYLYKKPFFIFGWTATICIWISLALLYRRRQKLETDVRYARRLQSPRKAKKDLETARRFMMEGKQNEFYNTIFKVLLEYLSGKLHLSNGNVTIEAIDLEFKKHPTRSNRRDSEIDLTNVLNNVKSILNECEMVRYASIKLDHHHMEENFKKLENIIDQLERVWR